VLFGLPGGQAAGAWTGLTLTLWSGRLLGTLQQWFSALVVCLLLALLGGAIGFLVILARKLQAENAEQASLDHSHQQVSSLLKKAIESSSGSILVTDLTGAILASSRNVNAACGLPPARAGENAQPVTLQAFASGMKKPDEFRAFLRKGCQQPEGPITARFDLVNGRTLYVTCLPYQLENQTIGLLWKLNDPIDDKSFEASPAALHSLVDSAIDGITLVNMDGRIVEWNTGMQNITGIWREEALGKYYWDVLYRMMPPDEQLGVSLDLFKSITLTSLHNIGPHEPPVERNIRRPDGMARTIESAEFAVVLDTGVIYASITRDITERKAAEVALLQSHAIDKNMLNSFPDAALLIDRDLKILAFNRVFASTTNMPAESIIGSNLVSFMDPLTVERHRKVIREVFRTGKPHSSEEQGADGCYYDTLQPIKNEQGQTIQVALFSRDITTAHQRERELEAVVSISSALRAALTPAEVYPIILDQLEIVLNVEGIGLILKDNDTGDVHVEQARGAWTSLLNLRFTAEQATRGPVLIMNEPYLNNNIASEQHLFQTRPFHGLVATACIPLTIRNEVIGSLWIGRSTPISTEEQRILMTLGDITANAVHRARLFEQTRTNAEQLAAASELGRSLSETLAIHDIYERLSTALVEMLPDTSTVIILRYDPTSAYTNCVYAIQNDVIVDPLDLPLLLPGQGLQAQVIASREPAILSDLENGPFPKENAVLLPGIQNIQSLLCVPMLVKNQVLGLIQVQSFSKERFTQADVRFLSLIGNTAAIAIQNALLFENLQQSHDNLTLAYEATLEGWGRALDLRDHGTQGHSYRAVSLTVELGRRMGLSADELANLRRGTQLHDIGKMGVPDSILLKPGPLTDNEWKVMRMHPQYAYEMLESVPEFRAIRDIPYCHHEKWDGTGYPQGLKGSEIPIGARIFAVVDVWEALHSDRPYRQAWPQDKVMAYLRDQSGKQFDPQVVDEFLRMVDTLDFERQAPPADETSL
jgi:PAS domain S-box-containing protein